MKLIEGSQRKFAAYALVPGRVTNFGFEFVKILCLTRMHSSRMRPTRLRGEGGRCCPEGEGRKGDVVQRGKGGRCCPEGGGRYCDLVPGGGEVLSRGGRGREGGRGRCCPEGGGMYGDLVPGEGGVVRGGRDVL